MSRSLRQSLSHKNWFKKCRALQPGHRIAVQVQSSWFPLYDRNPQSFVPNIFFAQPADYQKAEQKVFHSPADASYIDLPVVKP
jgi:predicted acyl esterase